MSEASISRGVEVGRDTAQASETGLTEFDLGYFHWRVVQRLHENGERIDEQPNSPASREAISSGFAIAAVTLGPDLSIARPL